MSGETAGSASAGSRIETSGPREGQGDAGELKAARTALDASEQRLRNLYNLTPAMLLSFDRDWRVVGVSDDWLAVMGYEGKEVIGSHILDFVSEESRRRALAESLPRLERVGVTRDLPRQLVKKNGEIMDVLISAVAEGRDGPFLSVVVDITERKRAVEAIQRAKEEAERANRAKSTFLAAASHDLRQPVQALRFLLEALERGDDPSRRVAIAREMQGALEGMSGILDALLDISQLDAGHVTPKVETFPISDLLRSYESLLISALGSPEVRLVPCGAAVHSDPRLLGRIVENFVSNALRYADEGRILIGCRRAGPNLRIEVWDSGIGIAEDHFEAVFEEFYQVGNVARDRRQGLGLGLAIVKRLASMLGHAIELRSVPEKGSMFAVVVPLALATARTDRDTVPAEPDDDPAMRATILVMDDDADVLRAARWLLESLGYTALTAASADEALTKVAAIESAPDVIVADYRLSDGATGPEAIERIRSELKATVPGLILTGDTSIGGGMTAGLATLHKPIRATELRAAIRGLVKPAKSLG